VRLVAIDPGARSVGIAVFEYAELYSTRWLEAPNVTALIDLIGPLSSVDVVAVEVPQVYPGSRSLAPAGDLISVAFTAGAVAATCRAPNWLTFAPARWKGNAPKEAIRKRILSTLSPSEISTLNAQLTLIAPSKQHNAFDAVGIGLYALNRVARGIK